jgi:hypothetical protein
MASATAKVSFWISIAVGLWILILSIRGAFSANWGAALGVFLIVLGLNGFTSLRIAKLEEAAKETRKKNDSSSAS